jgi:hypothetical protein
MDYDHYKHQYLCSKETIQLYEKATTTLHETCPAELKVFVGILIYMELHKSYSEEVYWIRDLSCSPLHTCALHMTLNRYQAIKRYLHISPNLPIQSMIYELTTEEEAMPIQHLQHIWWHKMEPLASIVRSAFVKYYTPSSQIAIDELMIRCYGRSQHTYKMPNKPIPQAINSLL